MHKKGQNLPDLTLVLLGAGNSTRFNQKFKKQWMRIKDDPLWLFVAKRFSFFADFADIVIVANKNEIDYMKNFADFTFVEGSNERQLSLKNALAVVKTPYVLVSDIARACVQERVIRELIANKECADTIVPYISVSDTVHYQNRSLNREELKLIQTPQLSKTSILKTALNSNEIFTDDSSAVLKSGGKVSYIKGDIKTAKLTYMDDIEKLPCLKPPSQDTFVGFGYDVHPFEENKEMFLCGVKLDTDYGFKAHSDGDVALHALIDSLLGAIGAGDIGELFPDNDDLYKDIDSKKLLKNVYNFLSKVGYEILNIDITIIAQKPKILRYKQKMRSSVAKILDLPPSKINIKATTTEKLGFIGRKEGVGVNAVANLKYYDWTQIEGRAS